MEQTLILYGKDGSGNITPLQISTSAGQGTINYINKVSTAEDVSMTASTATTTGAQLVYNNSNSKWENRLKAMYSFSQYGQQAGWGASGERNVLQSANWTTISSSSSTGIPVGTFSFSTTTGIISGLTSTRYYRIDITLSLQGFNISATTQWSLKLYDQSSTLLISTQITQITDGTMPSL